MAKSTVAPQRIKKWINEEWQESVQDLVAVEEPMEIRLLFNDLKGSAQEKSVAVTMRTPTNDFELAAGFLFTEGILTDSSQVKYIRHCVQAEAESQENIVKVALAADTRVDLEKVKRNFYSTSSCGVCGKESIEAVTVACPLYQEAPPMEVPKSLVLSLPELLMEQQHNFKFTGGIHAVALFNTEGVLLQAKEDVGRHNALDKLIGHYFLKGEQLPLDNHLLLLSGRISFELVQKAAMAGIKVVCAVGAPSSLAISAAQKFDITLVGFVREVRFNVYHQSKHVTFL